MKKAYLLARVSWTDFEPLGIFADWWVAANSRPNKEWKLEKSDYHEVARAKETMADLVIYRLDMNEETGEP